MSAPDAAGRWQKSVRNVVAYANPRISGSAAGAILNYARQPDGEWKLMSAAGGDPSARNGLAGSGLLYNWPQVGRLCPAEEVQPGASWKVPAGFLGDSATLKGEAEMTLVSLDRSSAAETAKLSFRGPAFGGGTRTGEMEIDLKNQLVTRLQWSDASDSYMLTVSVTATPL
jgi:hypothetical protein